MAFAGMEIITLYFLTVLLYNIKNITDVKI